MLADLLRLILLVLFLPIILILIGPLLILAVWRGHQPVGPITLETSRYSLAGRVGALVLGLLLWLVVWGGLAWFALHAFTPLVVISSAPVTPATVTPQDTPTPTPIPPTPTLVTLVELTSQPLTVTLAAELETPTPLASTPTSTAPAPPVTPTGTPLPTVEVTAKSTPTSPPIIPTVETPVTISPSAEVTQAQEQRGGTFTPTISPQATLTPAESEAVVEVVKAGNILLKEAISQAEEENLQSLETIWRDLAFQVAQKFATQMYGQYARPVVVEFEYLEPPMVDRQSTHDEVMVTSRERWAYGGPSKIDREEVFDFIYILTQEDEAWVISRYTYRNVLTSTPMPGPTRTPSPTSTLTPTSGPTAEG